MSQPKFLRSFIRAACAAVLLARLALFVRAQTPTEVAGNTPGPSPQTSAAEFAAPASDLIGIALHPEAKTDRSGEQWNDFNGVRIVRNVVSSTLTPFLPDPAKATGAAVIITPGGGFLMLVMDEEGYDTARWLADHGVAAFVLKHRLNPTPREFKAFEAELMKLLGGIGAANAEKKTVKLPMPDFVLEDAKAAVRLVRSRAAEWHVDPARVGFLGFSSGAIATLRVGLGPDAADRPDFIGLLYGPMNAIEVPPFAPPAFLAIALDDPFFSGDVGGLVTAWKEAKRPVEAHLYGKGGHGFALRKQGLTSDLWIDEFHAWMKAYGLLKQAK